MQGDPEEGLGGFGAEQPPIIIIRKIVRGGGHHGGAWKVAFADFVTAMMALFMVLWLINSGKQTKDAVAAYFSDPKGFAGGRGSGQGGLDGGMAVGRGDLEGLAERIQESMKEMPEFDLLKENVAMTVTGDGLRIELLETEKGMFFQSGNSSPTSSGTETLQLIGDELKKLNNKIVIEGHTDARPFRGRAGYSNWELSVDRANVARRILLANGLAKAQVVQVRGFADVALRTPDDPEDPSNRRISLIVMYNDL